MFSNLGSPKPSAIVKLVYTLCELTPTKGFHELFQLATDVRPPDIAPQECIHFYYTRMPVVQVLQHSVFELIGDLIPQWWTLYPPEELQPPYTAMSNVSSSSLSF